MNETMNNPTMNEVNVAPVEIDRSEIAVVNPMELANPSATAMYCSITGEDVKTKAAVYNAINSPDKRLKECIGETFNLKDVVAHTVELVDENTGELVQLMRTVLIDDKGVSYEAVSTGVNNALNRIMQIFGQPSTWEKPLKVKVLQKPTRNGNNMITTLKVEQ